MLSWSFLPPVLSDISTFGLAILGIIVAIFPADESRKRLKISYIVAIVVLVVTGLAANNWQRDIDERRRIVAEADVKTAQADLKRAQADFSQDLKAVRSSNNKILSFVSDPPTQFTSGEAMAFVRQLAESRNSGGTRLEELTNPRLADMARAFAVDLREKAQEWRAARNNAYLNDTDYVYTHAKNQQEKLDANKKYKRDEADLDKKWSADMRQQILIPANQCRLEILSRLLPSDKFVPDTTNEVLFTGSLTPESLISAADYMDELSKRLP